MGYSILNQNDYLKILINGCASNSEQLGKYFIEQAKVFCKSASDYTTFFKELNTANSYLINIFIVKAFHSDLVKKYKPIEKKESNYLGLHQQDVYNDIWTERTYTMEKPTIYDVVVKVADELPELGYSQGVLFVEWFEYAKVQIEYAKEMLEYEIDETKLIDDKFSEQYETDSLKEVFLNAAIESYIEIEKRLLLDKLIDNNCKFITAKGNKQKLLTLIYFLMQHHYLRPKIQVKKSPNNLFNIYRRYFEKRYQTKLSDSKRKFDYTQHKDVQLYFSNFIPIFMK